VQSQIYLITLQIQGLCAENHLQNTNQDITLTTGSGIARICCEEGQSWKVGHGALTANFRAGCSSCSRTNSFVTNAVPIERAVSCWHSAQLI